LRDLVDQPASGSTCRRPSRAPGARNAGLHRVRIEEVGGHTLRGSTDPERGTQLHLTTILD
jgi:hypothetical protein